MTKMTSPITSGRCHGKLIPPGGLEKLTATDAYLGRKGAEIKSLTQFNEDPDHKYEGEPPINAVYVSASIDSSQPESGGYLRAVANRQN
jgi:hypothetical protein